MANIDSIIVGSLSSKTDISLFSNLEDALSYNAIADRLQILLDKNDADSPQTALWLTLQNVGESVWLLF